MGKVSSAEELSKRLFNVKSEIEINRRLLKEQEVKRSELVKQLTRLGFKGKLDAKKIKIFIQELECNRDELRTKLENRLSKVENEIAKAKN